MQWCLESDEFHFRIELKDKPLTRRSILFTVSSIFDPLGMVAPFLLKGKQILQQICKEDIGSDDKIPGTLQADFERSLMDGWMDGLLYLTELKIPRCYKPVDFGEVAWMELHNFSDANITGYGQCSYLRMKNRKGRMHCSLVMAKSRETPLKPITVSRLELAAALVSVNISSFLRRELKYENITETFWVDNKVVLGYISNDARCFHTFVANRVQQIRDQTKPTQWRYISTTENPADDASRGLSARQSTGNSRWWTGPSRLWEPVRNPDSLEVIPELSADDPEAI